MQLIIPDACWGSYRTRLLVDAFWPIVVIFVAFGGSVSIQLAKGYRNRINDSARRKYCHAAVCAGVQNTLPLSLVATFLLVPSTSNSIFQTFVCTPIEFDHRADVTFHCELALTGTQQRKGRALS